LRKKQNALSVARYASLTFFSALRALGRMLSKVYSCAVVGLEGASSRSRWTRPTACPRSWMWALNPMPYSSLWKGWRRQLTRRNAAEGQPDAVPTVSLDLQAVPSQDAG